MCRKRQTVRTTRAEATTLISTGSPARPTLEKQKAQCVATLVYNDFVAESSVTRAWRPDEWRSSRARRGFLSSLLGPSCAHGFIYGGPCREGATPAGPFPVRQPCTVCHPTLGGVGGRITIVEWSLPHG